VEFAISLPNWNGTEGWRLSGAAGGKNDCCREGSVEAVYIIHPHTPQEWAYYAYQVGNRHQQVMIGENELIFLQNPAVRSLLEQLHVQFETGERPFTAALANVHSH
jgi:urease accessory protein UreE